MSPSFTRSFAVAAFVHLAAGGTVALIAPAFPPLTPVEPRTLDFEVVEVSVVPSSRAQVPSPTDLLDAVPSAPPPNEGAVAMRSIPPARSRPEGPSTSENGDRGGGDGAGEPGADGAGEPGAPGPGAGGSGGGSGRASPAQLGLDRGLAWMWVDPNKRAARPRPASSTGGLQEVLDAHDRRLGLGFGGPVVSALHAAASTVNNAPQTGSAVFEAIVDGRGRAQSVVVLSANGDMAGWQNVAQHVLRILRARVLRVPPGARGLALTLRVVARYQLPSGSKPGEAIRQQGAGAVFDLSDIGAEPTRNIAVQVLSERRM